MKNVLFIVYYFPPMGGSGVQRPLKFVKYLREFGWNPIVLCPNPGAYHTFDESLLDELDAMDVEVHRVEGKTPFHIGKSVVKSAKHVQVPDGIARIVRRILRLFMFPDNKKGWIEPAVKQGLKLIQDKEINALFSTAPPFSNHVIGKKLSKISGLPLVLDYRDEWINNHFMDGMFGWQKNKMRSIESECLKQASVATVLDSYMEQHLKAEYGELLNKISVIPHGFDPEDFDTSTDSNFEYQEGKLNILYSGLFYESNQPYIFLKALKRAGEQGLLKLNQIHLHFQGGLDDRIKHVIEKMSLSEMVSDYGYLPHKKAVLNIQKADLLWMISNFDKSHKQIKTGKLFEYFGTANPILGIMHPGKEAELLQEYEAGYIGIIDDTQQITEQLGIIFKDWESNKFPVANNEFIKRYNRKGITEKLANIFNKISS